MGRPGLENSPTLLSLLSMGSAEVSVAKALAGTRMERRSMMVVCWRWSRRNVQIGESL